MIQVLWSCFYFATFYIRTSHQSLPLSTLPRIHMRYIPYPNPMYHLPLSNTSTSHFEDKLLNTVSGLSLPSESRFTNCDSGFTLLFPCSAQFLSRFNSDHNQKEQEGLGVLNEFCWNILHKDWGHTRQARAGDGCLIKERVYILNIHWGSRHALQLLTVAGTLQYIAHTQYNVLTIVGIHIRPWETDRRCYTLLEVQFPCLSGYM